MQNIFDEHYYTYRYSSDTANAGVYSINPPFDSGLIGPPRSFTVDMSAKF
jgi:iron complex outermembrane receptor protein